MAIVLPHAPSRLAFGADTPQSADVVTGWHYGWRVRQDSESDAYRVRRYEIADTEVVYCDAPPCSGTRTSGDIDGVDDSRIGLLIVTAGRERVEVGGAAAEIGPGQAFLWDTRAQGTFVCEAGLTKYTVFFPRAVLEGWTPYLVDLLEAGPLPPARTLAIRSLIGAVESTSDTDLAAQSAAPLASAMRELLYLAVDGHTVTPSDHSSERWRRAIDLVESRLPASTTAEDVAEHLHVSVRAVYQLFADRGTTLRSHVRRRRLHRATRDLSGHPERSIGEIAAGWGFADQASFTKAYRAEFGVTPGVHRRRPTV
ncbi:helix-turn-helix domain-containing protein [Dietzia natronolimnaea]|uniref:helix-turn-helix domain-containing protein n=1 Tax=Dietzia natronolimnaea TaxID=161920 RepID=UPI0015FAA028|nr:helix-turn-helix domain-containing protein [Dietzia natronolimnaea]MBB1038586.1 helix-turn-helix domain-containing protein [Dietzia natronolimnaea]